MLRRVFYFRKRKKCKKVISPSGTGWMKTERKTKKMLLLTAEIGKIGTIMIQQAGLSFLADGLRKGFDLNIILYFFMIRLNESLKTNL